MSWLLLDRRDPNALNSLGLTPLGAAASRDRIDVMALLLAAGADPRVPRDRGPLYHSAAHPSASRVLLDAGATPGQEELDMAAGFGNATLVEAALRAAPRAPRDAALEGAIRQGHRALALRLLDGYPGVPVGVPEAALACDVALLDALLARGADPNGPPEWGGGPGQALSHAVSAGLSGPPHKRPCRFEPLERLAASGAELASPGGDLALLNAVSAGDAGMVTRLLELGARPNPGWDSLPLLAARDAAVARLLLDGGADASRPDLLVSAAAWAPPEVLEAYVVAGASPTASHQGRTALGEAVFRDNVDGALWLLDHGADLSMGYHERPLDEIALQRGRTSLAVRLREGVR